MKFGIGLDDSRLSTILKNKQKQNAEKTGNFNVRELFQALKAKQLIDKPIKRVEPQLSGSIWDEDINKKPINLHNKASIWEY